ncbi:hypothetical protein VCHC57A2_1759, partial [Vibrio cholerae HC-57A2]
MAGEW